MKLTWHFKILLFLIAFSLPVKSQNKNLATHTGMDYAGGIVSINQKSFYTENTYTNCCFLGLYITSLDNNGAISWQQSILVDEFTEQKKLIASMDKKIVLIAKGTGCDVNRNKNVFAKLDTLGNFIFNTVIQPTDVINDIAEYSDGTYYLMSPTKIYHYDAAGLFLGQITHTLSGLKSISVLANGNLLLNCTMTNNYNVEMSTNGTVINQVQCINTYTKFLQSSNGTIFGLDAGGVLSRFNSSLTLLGSANQNIGVNLKITDFVISNDTVYAAGYAVTNNKPFYAALNTNFNIIHLPQPSNHLKIIPTGITKNNKGKIRIITKGNSNVSADYSFTGLFEMPFNGNFYAGSDIGISRITQVSSNIFNNGNLNNWITMDLNVTVKNYGTDTVKSFYVNYFAKNFLCLALLHKSVTTNLAPGDSMVVNTGSFFVTIVPLSVGANSPVTVAPCLFTSIPNKQNDVNISNDSKCYSTSLQLGIDGNSPDKNTVTIYPNPMASTINVNANEEIKSLKIMDITGKELLYKMCGFNSGTVSLTTEIEAGIYFLQIETLKGDVVKKLVKE